jgi:glycosyltransferase involved in cell wall biosynthesis
VRSLSSRWHLAAGRYLVYPANFWPHKNHEMLMTAFGMARRLGLDPAITLVLTGSPGERQDWLAGAARRLDLADAVVFAGYVSNDELAALVGSASGMIFPSLYEGFGLPVVEAMAAGVPVACSDTTALVEVADAAALLFDPRSPTEIARALVTLCDDEVERLRLVAAGRARAREFSEPRRMAAEYWDLFEHACRRLPAERA